MRVLPPGESFTSQDSEDALLVKINGDGSYAWGMVVAGASNNLAEMIKFNGDWLIFTGRDYNEAIITGNGNNVPLNSTGSCDVFNIRITTAGEVVWAVSWGTTGGDFPGGVAFHPDGQLINTGRFGNSIDLDFSEGEYVVEGLGVLSYYIAAMDPTPVSVEEHTPSAFSLYPNPSNGLVQLQVAPQMHYDAIRLLYSSGKVI